MAEQGTYERFPLWIVVLSNLVTALIYVFGAYILAGFGVIASALFLLYCLSLELTVLKRSCVNCYYYGRICGSAKEGCALYCSRKATRRNSSNVKYHGRICCLI